MWMIILLAAIPAWGQWTNVRSPNIPRTPDGKPDLMAPLPRTDDGKPDLSGVWIVSQSFVDGVPKYMRNLASDLSQEEAPEMQPWAAALVKERTANLGRDAPTSRCLPPGVPRIMLMARPFEIVQTKERILLVYEGGAHVWRQVWMDGRAHPKEPNPNWLGHSIGRWEEETLVVDTTGFNDMTWLDDAGHLHTEQLHVVERFTRTSATAMKYEVTIDDPGAYTQSWTFGSSFSFYPGEKLAEDICLDKISR